MKPDERTGGWVTIRKCPSPVVVPPSPRQKENKPSYLRGFPLFKGNERKQRPVVSLNVCGAVGSLGRDPVQQQKEAKEEGRPATSGGCVKAAAGFQAGGTPTQSGGAPLPPASALEGPQCRPIRSGPRPAWTQCKARQEADRLGSTNQRSPPLLPEDGIPTQESRGGLAFGAGARRIKSGRAALLVGIFAFVSPFAVGSSAALDAARSVKPAASPPIPSLPGHRKEATARFSRLSLHSVQKPSHLQNGKLRSPGDGPYLATPRAGHSKYGSLFSRELSRDLFPSRGNQLGREDRRQPIHVGCRAIV